MEFPTHLNSSTELNLHISQDPMTIEGRNSSLFAGEKVASFPSEHRGQFIEVQEGWTSPMDSLNHTGKQSLAHKGGNIQSKQGFIGCREKAWKVKKTKRRMVMGVDVGLEESCNLSLCALVGRLSYRSLCKQPITDWMQSSWVLLLGYSPELLTLSRGWFGFVFKNPKDTVLILERLWVFECSSLMLKRW
jgi:hypothetical protein